jgi:uncharacterized membrane protein
MVWQQIVMGPQLVGVVLLVVGLIMSWFPPKKINSYYGYRMPSAMKNQATWDAANCYSANYMVKAGLVTIVIGAIILVVQAIAVLPGNLFSLISIVTMLFSGIVPAVLTIVATEKHLTKTFGD